VNEKKKTHPFVWGCGGLLGISMIIGMVMQVKQAPAVAAAKAQAAVDTKAEAEAEVKRQAAMVKAHKIWVGMTEAQLVKSLGKPDKVNRTVTANGKSEQWVYHGNYIYVEGGVVTAFQN
jgi:hypothetical protein